MGLWHRVCCLTRITPKHFLPMRCLPGLNITTSANINEINEKEQLSNDTSKATDWTVIYRFPMVRWASAFNRLKFYQLIGTSAGVPASFIFENAEILPQGSSIIVGAVGVSGIITLSIFSLLLKNLIGFIYINKGMDYLKFAYVDYWGRRQDAVVAISDIVPNRSEDKLSAFSFSQKIDLRSDRKLSFKLLKRHGVIIKPEIFGVLFE